MAHSGTVTAPATLRVPRTSCAHAKLTPPAPPPPPAPLLRCTGHSGTVTHVDWSLPIVLPGTPHDGKFVLQTCDTALELLYWDPTTGEEGP